MSFVRAGLSIAPAFEINGPVTHQDPAAVLDEEWATIKDVLEGTPPQCTHPLILRRWQTLRDLNHSGAIQYRYPQKRWTRAKTAIGKERRRRTLGS